MDTQPPHSLPPHQKQTSGLAITSLITGIASFFIPIITSFVAIICGHIARSRIKKSNGALEGKGLAITGLICGYTSLVIVTATLSYVVHSYKESRKNSKIYKQITEEQVIIDIDRGKQIHALVIKYESDHGKFPDTLSELVDKGYIHSIDHLQPVTGGHWIYFLGLTSQSDNSKYIIRSDANNVVIFIDGSSGDRNITWSAEPTDFPMRDHDSVQE